jgi:hypothetical protein
MNPCVYSAHVFVSNAVLCAYAHEFRYAYAFLFLYATSILYHTNVPHVGWIDKCAIGAVVTLGLCKFLTRSYELVRSCFIVGACMACAAFYFFGLSKTDILHALFIHGSTFVGHGLICL